MQHFDSSAFDPTSIIMSLHARDYADAAYQLMMWWPLEPVNYIYAAGYDRMNPVEALTLKRSENRLFRILATLDRTAQLLLRAECYLLLDDSAGYWEDAREGFRRTIAILGKFGVA